MGLTLLVPAAATAFSVPLNAAAVTRTRALPVMDVATATKTIPEMSGKVVPTGGVASWYDSGIRLVPDAEPAVVAESLPVATPATELEDTESTPAVKAEPRVKAVREAEWNPNGITTLPLGPLGSIDLEKFCVPEYLKSSPSYLDGTMAADAAFDPLCLMPLAKPTPMAVKEGMTATERRAQAEAMSAEEQQAKLGWLRESEIKHSRLAMLAVMGWPSAELANGQWLQQFTNGRAPSLFNGALLDFPVAPFVLLALVEVARFEFLQSESKPQFKQCVRAQVSLGWAERQADAHPCVLVGVQNDLQSELRNEYVAGDLGFDPLGVATGEGPIAAFLPMVGDQDALQKAEITNGRVAMLAITGFAVQEFLWGVPVVAQTPWFFGH